MFEIGKIYNRRTDIHGVYKGQQYGGIATPSEHPYVFIFTSDAGEAYGYNDGFGADDTFWYTGEGQVGDMEITKGNLAIKEHAKNNKQILLFESVDKGEVRLVGNCEYITHHIEQQPDKNGDLRNAIIFHLNIEQADQNTVKEPEEDYKSTKKPTKGMSLKELRDIAIKSASKSTSKKQQISTIQARSKAIKLYAKKRAGATCEGCGENAPFNSKEGPYLEVHHMFRLADGGPDKPENVIALCPTCHRRAHYALDAKEFNAELILKVKAKEDEIA